MKHEESQLQITCVRWFRYQYPQFANLLFSVPNGGKRSLRTAQILKSEGVVAGVSDLIMMVARNGYHCLCIEMKVRPNKQTENQKQWQRLVEREGMMYVVCYEFEDFKNIVYEYLNNE